MPVIDDSCAVPYHSNWINGPVVAAALRWWWRRWTSVSSFPTVPGPSLWPRVCRPPFVGFGCHPPCRRHCRRVVRRRDVFSLELAIDIEWPLDTSLATCAIVSPYRSPSYRSFRVNNLTSRTNQRYDPSFLRLDYYCCCCCCCCYHHHHVHGPKWRWIALGTPLGNHPTFVPSVYSHHHWWFLLLLLLRACCCSWRIPVPNPGQSRYADWFPIWWSYVDDQPAICRDRSVWWKIDKSRPRMESGIP